MRFPNPLGLAAGFDKNAEVPGAMLRLGFGFVEVGTLTPRPQGGNARPRLFRLPEDAAVINRFGFNNEGFERARARLMRRSSGGAIGVIGVNVGANRDAADRIEDYVLGVKTFAAARRLSDHQHFVAEHARLARPAAARCARRSDPAGGRRPRRDRAPPAAPDQDRARPRRPRARRHRRDRARPSYRRPDRLQHHRRPARVAELEEPRPSPEACPAGRCSSRRRGFSPAPIS